MPLALGPGATGDKLAAKQDVGTDVNYEIDGDLRTISGSTDAYGSLAQGVLGTSAAALVGPASGTDMLIGCLHIANPGASTRIVTFYKTKNSTTYDATTQWGPAITLGPGETAMWGNGLWAVYDNVGRPKLVMLTPLTTKGDLFTYSTQSIRKAVSANGGLLIANSADATGLDYLVLTALGDLIKGAAGAIPTRLAVGVTAGMYLRSSGSDFAWSLGPLTTTGDLLVGVTGAEPARLAVGANTTFLRGGTNPTYQAASAATPKRIGGESLGTNTNPPAADDHVHSLSLAAGKVADTTVNNTVTPTTGGVTFAMPNLAAGQMYRIRAFGTHVAVSSATARNATVQPFIGSSALTSIAIAVTASQALTSGWECEFILALSSATACWVTGVLKSGISIPATYIVAGLASRVTAVSGTTGSLTTAGQTLDLRFFWSVSVATDQWVVKQITMERIL